MIYLFRGNTVDGCEILQQFYRWFILLLSQYLQGFIPELQGSAHHPRSGNGGGIFFHARGWCKGNLKPETPSKFREIDGFRRRFSHENSSIESHFFWRFPEIGVPLVIIHLSRILTKPSSYGGTPMTMWKSFFFLPVYTMLYHC